jgi:hypothetical protein
MDFVEPVVAPPVPAQVLRGPVVGGEVEVPHALSDRLAAVHPERDQVAIPGTWAVVATLEERAGVARVSESAGARERSEELVERAVLLHQDHDVLDVLQVGVAAGRAGQGRPHGAGQSAPDAERDPRFEELATRDIGDHAPRDAIRAFARPRARST